MYEQAIPRLMDRLNVLKVLWNIVYVISVIQAVLAVCSERKDSTEYAYLILC